MTDLEDLFQCLAEIKNQEARISHTLDAANLMSFASSYVSLRATAWTLRAGLKQGPRSLTVDALASGIKFKGGTKITFLDNKYKN